MDKKSEVDDVFLPTHVMFSKFFCKQSYRWTLTDKGYAVWPDDSRGQEMEVEGLAIGHHGVSSIIASLQLDHRHCESLRTRVEYDSS